MFLARYALLQSPAKWNFSRSRSQSQSQSRISNLLRSQFFRISRSRSRSQSQSRIKIHYDLEIFLKNVTNMVAVIKKIVFRHPGTHSSPICYSKTHIRQNLWCKKRVFSYKFAQNFRDLDPKFRDLNLEILIQNFEISISISISITVKFPISISKNLNLAGLYCVHNWFNWFNCVRSIVFVL